MNNWREAILNEFVPKVSKLTLVADPDALLTEEKLALELRARGFDLIEFNDPVEFRYAYESKYRTIWDQGQSTDLVVILKLQDAELDSLPYDLLQAGRILSFNLGALFPKLSYPVLERLDRSLLDILYDAQMKSTPERLGDNATIDFILRYIFGIAAELIHNDVELLRALLRLHYEPTPMPHSVAVRLIQVLRQEPAFKTWPLDKIIPDAQAFFAFLQERWPVFLVHSNCLKRPLKETLKYSGPSILPLDHQDLKVYLDNLFAEGKLTPIKVDEIEAATLPWVRCGLVSLVVDGEERRIQRLFELVDETQPSPEAAHSEWLALALKWAELSSLVLCGNNAVHLLRLRELGDSINTAFADWLPDHYAGLINLSPTTPAMLHQVARHLARELDGPDQTRLALIVVDGLALDQWVTIRQLLQSQDHKLLLRESATFAWLPSLTSVSRQTIFAGKAPLYFPSSINNTNSEEKLWKQFWLAYGLSPLDVVYQRGLGDDLAPNVLESLIHPDKTKVVGLVVDKIDKIMHGMHLGATGMHNQLRQWGQGGFLSSLIGSLLDYGYAVWLTSDHGNIECVGQGRPAEGVMAEIRGERARVYPTPELRAQVAKSFPSAHEWPPVGLPEGYYPLLATGQDAFTTKGDTLVGHGGLSIEELIVPLIKCERRNK